MYRHLLELMLSDLNRIVVCAPEGAAMTFAVSMTLTTTTTTRKRGASG